MLMPTFARLDNCRLCASCVQVTIGGRPVHIGGMCKGSGMIHPNMATMLGVVTCDAAVEPEVWRGMLRRACDASFNAVRIFGSAWRYKQYRRDKQQYTC